jgi:hypothetical protein
MSDFWCMQNIDSSLEKQAHPFELSGLGTGPYRWVGFYSFPSKGLAEANPDAYQNALREMPRDLVNGCGTCAHCGTPITNVCIVRDGQGRHYGIGNVCIEKTGDTYLGNKAKVALAQLQREQRRQREAAKRAAATKKWLAQIDPATGETNAVIAARKAAETRAAQKREEAEREARKQAVMAKWGFMVPILRAQSRTDGDFCYNIAARILYGTPLEGRVVDICAEIYAKAHGRRGSKAYDAAEGEFYRLTEFYAGA